MANAKLYHAAAPGQIYPVNISVRMRGTTPATFAGRLREISAVLDPNLQLRTVGSMDEVMRREQAMMRLVAAGLTIPDAERCPPVGGRDLRMMSFTVAQRRKEIGIRSALGADPRRILANIFSRALGQLAIGAVLGVVAAALLGRATNGELMQGNGAVVLPIVALFMMTVGVLAAVGPARRGLRIHPTEALREQ